MRSLPSTWFAAESMAAGCCGQLVNLSGFAVGDELSRKSYRNFVADENPWMRGVRTSKDSLVLAEDCF